MECFPLCEVALQNVGTTSVRTKLDVCQQPAVLTLSLKSGGKFTTAPFTAGNALESRPIQNNRWDLNLKVHFTQATTGVYHAKACLENVRDGDISCFMNSTLSANSSLCSANRNGSGNSDFVWVLLCIILITCLLFVGISVLIIMNKFNSTQKSSNSRKPSSMSIEKIAVSRRATSNYPTFNDTSTYLLSPNYFNDERLAVIAEVDEKEQMSEASTSCPESSNSLHQRLEQEKQKFSVNSACKSRLSPLVPKTTLIFQKDQIILPQNLNHARQNSQPLIFPTSTSLESLTIPSQSATFVV